jgi:hypothetical protein
MFAMEPFQVSKHRPAYQSRGCHLFIFSDGYADQFGGPMGKKLKYQPLKDLLVSLVGKDMEEQGLLLDREFEKWKGDIDQVDDVVLIGMRF